MFNGHALTADLAKDAHMAINPLLLSKGRLKVVDESFADIVLVPLVKHVTKKSAVIIGID